MRVIPLHARLTGLATAASLLALALGVTRLHGQQDTTIAVSGVVGDAQSGRPLESAIVTIQKLGVRTLTDENGRFVLFDIPAGEHQWLFRMLGYADWEQEMVLENLEHIRVGLLAQPIALENITVTVDRLEQRRKRAAVSVHALTWREINAVVASNVADVVMRRSPSPYQSCPDRSLAPIPTAPTQGRARYAPIINEIPSAAESICLTWRGQLVSPTIYLNDELFPTPLDMLYSYVPEEIHTIEYYSFGRSVRVYTIDFVESGRALLSSSLINR